MAFLKNVIFIKHNNNVYINEQCTVTKKKSKFYTVNNDIEYVTTLVYCFVDVFNT